MFCIESLTVVVLCQEREEHQRELDTMMEDIEALKQVQELYSTFYNIQLLLW